MFGVKLSQIFARARLALLAQCSLSLCVQVQGLCFFVFSACAAAGVSLSLVFCGAANRRSAQLESATLPLPESSQALFFSQGP